MIEMSFKVRRAWWLTPAFWAVLRVAQGHMLLARLSGRPANAWRYVAICNWLAERGVSFG